MTSLESQTYECVEPVGRIVLLGEVVPVIEADGMFHVPKCMPMSARYFNKHFVRRWS